MSDQLLLNQSLHFKLNWSIQINALEIRACLQCTLLTAACREHKLHPCSVCINSSIHSETLLRWIKTGLNPVGMYTTRLSKCQSSSSQIYTAIFSSLISCSEIFPCHRELLELFSIASSLQELSLHHVTTCHNVDAACFSMWCVATHTFYTIASGMRCRHT